MTGQPDIQHHMSRGMTLFWVCNSYRASTVKIYNLITVKSGITRSGREGTGARVPDDQVIPKWKTKKTPYHICAQTQTRGAHASVPHSWRRHCKVNFSHKNVFLISAGYICIMFYTDQTPYMLRRLTRERKSQEVWPGSWKAWRHCKLHNFWNGTLWGKIPVTHIILIFLWSSK